MKEMRNAIEKDRRKTILPLDDEDDDENHETPPHETSTDAIPTVDSSVSSLKIRKMTIIYKVPQLKSSQTIASKLRKTPEEVVEKRHIKGPSQLLPKTPEEVVNVTGVLLSLFTPRK